MFVFPPLFLGGHNHDGHTKLGLWIITGMLSFLVIEKIFAKEGEFEHVRHKHCLSKKTCL